MSLLIRQLGHGPQIGMIRFVDVVTEPPVTGDPMLYRAGDRLLFVDSDGIKYPLVVGADGSGVVAVTAADSPYAVLETDRVLLVDSTDGAVSITYPSAGGPFLGRPLQIIDAARNFDANSCTLDGNGKDISGSASVVLDTAGANAVTAWGGVEWSLQAAAGAAVAFDPHKPGPIGDDTASTVAATTLTAITVTATSSVVSKVLDIPDGSVPANASGHIKLFKANTTGLGLIGESGDSLFNRLDTSSGTSQVIKRYLAFSLADDATRDIGLPTGAKGGHGIVTAAGATSSASGRFSFAADATTSTNGLTFTNFDVADTDTKLCAYATGGALRIKNRLGSTQTILVELTDLVAV